MNKNRILTAVLAMIMLIGNAYAAKVAVYGAVGAESRRQELAYELLRLLMDEKISYFQNLSGNDFGRVTSEPKNMGLNFYPVNKEAAYDFLDEFEQRNSVLFYEQLGSGRFLQIYTYFCMFS